MDVWRPKQTAARGRPAAGILLACLIALAGGAPSSADEWTLYLESNFILDLAVDSAGVWAATPGGAVRFGTDGAIGGALTTLDGLPSNQLQAVARDGLGDLWFGALTGSAARRLEGGSSFWTYAGPEGLFSGAVTALAPVSGGIWIATTGGVAKFLGRDREAEGRNRFRAATGLLADSVLAVAEAYGSVWFGTSQGLSQLDPETGFGEHLLGQKVNALALDGEGRLLAGTELSVYRWNGAAWDTLGAGLAGTRVRDIVAVGDTLWAAVGAPRAVVRWTTATDSMWRTTNDSLLTPGVTDGWAAGRAIGYDPAGGLWVGTERGLARWDGVRWHRATVPGPASNFVLSIGEDASGGLWFTTGSDGNLFKYGGEPWSGARGVSRYASGQWQSFTRGASGLVDNNTYRVAGLPSGDVWVGTWGSGLSRYRLADSSWTTVHAGDGPGSDVVADLTAGTGGDLWMAAYGFGLSVLVAAGDSAGHWIQYPPGAGIPGDEAYQYPRAVAARDGIVWIGTYGVEVAGLGIARIDTHGTPHLKTDDVVTNFPPSSSTWGGVGGTVMGLGVEPGGRLWACTSSGVATYDGATWTSYTQGAGAAALGEVRGVALDSRGNRWFATKLGLARLEADGLTWHLYTSATSGLPLDDVMSVHVESATGDVWVGTWGSGAARLHLTAPVASGTGRQKLHPAPNPFRPGVDAQVCLPDLEEEATLRIYSLGGDLVRVIPPGAEKCWDGKNADGGWVASGAYLLSGDSAGRGPRTATLAVLR